MYYFYKNKSKTRIFIILKQVEEMSSAEDFIPYKRQEMSEEESIKNSASFYEFMNTRRSLRMFSDKPVLKKIIENIILTASTAPSGANKQPWIFNAISNKEIKHKIRIAAEEEEYKNYNGRMNEEWLEDLKPFATDWNKEFLEIAPWLIVVSRVIHNEVEGQKSSNYYINESVGIATGMLITAIHHAGLVGLTHTPSPMGFLMNVLNRPKNERAFLLIPIGYASDDAMIPNISRKKLADVSVFYE
jgi:nitroreductase